MAVTAAYLTSCRTAILALPELTAFRAALTALSGGTRATRPGLWNSCYSDAQAGLSPCYRLRKAIRDTVFSLADASVTPLERESTTRDFCAEYAPTYPTPLDAAAEAAELRRLIDEDRLS